MPEKEYLWAQKTPEEAVQDIFIEMSKTRIKMCVTIEDLAERSGVPAEDILRMENVDENAVSETSLAVLMKLILALDSRLLFVPNRMLSRLTEEQIKMLKENAAFAKTVRENREKLGMTIKNLAEESSLMEDTVARIEMGFEIPSDNTVSLLKLALGIQ